MGVMEQQMATLDKETRLPLMTFEDFLAWSGEETHAEWVEGRIQTLVPASIAHQLIKGFLFFLFKVFLQGKDLGIVLDAPTLMRLSTRPSGREPDLLFIAKPHLGQVLQNYIDGPADIVVEVISPESRERDRIEKYREYAQAGIPEYWLIDPTLKTAEFYTLREGAYEPASIDAEGRFWSNVLPGFWLLVTWLWEEPSLPEILRAWGAGPTREEAFQCDAEGLLIYPQRRESTTHETKNEGGTAA
jgi:Uma2 family endonuclease